MLNRRKFNTSTVLVSFEAPDRSAFQAWRGGLVETARRSVENRLLDAIYLVGALTRFWDDCAPHVTEARKKVTNFVTERKLSRWVLAWTFATVWLCY